jgi:hypothetical protein
MLKEPWISQRDLQKVQNSDEGTQGAHLPQAKKVEVQ